MEQARGRGRLPDGDRLRLACIKGKAIAKGVQVGGCALAELVQDVIGNSPGSTPSTALAQSGAGDGALARATLEDFRARIAGGAVFRFANGDR